MINVKYLKLIQMENQEQQVVSMPRIGDPAPEFKAVTTQGDMNFPADYKGKLGDFIQSPR